MFSKIQLSGKFLPPWFVFLALVICHWIFYPTAVAALNQVQITAAMGAGWNLGNQLEANSNGTPSETVWGNPVITQALITKIKSAGFKTIRIPVSYLSKMGAAPNYTIDAAWLGRVKEVVNYCINEGLYVIINIHGDGYETVTGAWLLVEASDQTAVKTKLQKVWQQIATAFAAYDEHLIFEAMNEVFDGNYYDPDPRLYQNLNAYNQVFIDAVRQTNGNNASRWLLIPGWNTNIDYTVNDYGFVMPADNYRSASIPANEKRIMISAHYYDPWEFCGDESGTITQWGAIATNSAKKTTWCQEDYMELRLNQMYYAFAAKGYPLVIGEWGVVDKTNDDAASNTYRQYFAKTFAAGCRKYSAVPVWWDNGYNGNYGFAVLNRSTLAFTQQGIIDSIMNGMNTNATPAPAPTPTPIPSGVAAKIAVLYKCGAATASSGSIRFSGASPF